MRYILCLIGAIILCCISSSVFAQEVWLYTRPMELETLRINYPADSNDTGPMIMKFYASDIDSISFRPCDSVKTGCCQFALRLLNTVSGTFKSIKVTPDIPSAVSGVYMDPNFDAPDWTLTESPNGTTYEFGYINGYIPTDTSFLDVGFTIQVNSGFSNPKIKVEWIDGNGNTQKSDNITLVCVPPEVNDDNNEYEWGVNTTNISGNYTDVQVFAGAEPEPCETESLRDFESFCGDITHSIDCSPGSLTITLSTTPVIASLTSGSIPEYKWTVNGNSYSGINFSAPISGQGNFLINIVCEVWGNVDEEIFSSDGSSTITSTYQLLCENSKNVSYCLPTAEFTNSTPKADCGGAGMIRWSIDFTPVTPCEPATYRWDFGDGSPLVTGTGQISEQTHLYAESGTYTVTLSITSSAGCEDVQTKKITISKECTPDFHAKYEWCDDNINREKTYSVTVTFTNKSVCFCGTKFTWDFGDPSSPDNILDTDCNQLEVTHTYIALPNTTFSPSLTMRDNDVCPTSVKVTHPFILKPIYNGLKVVACADGIVKFSNDSPGRVKWDLPNWQALTHDPSYYCLPSPFDLPLNIAINAAFNGLFGTDTSTTSIPQTFVNLFNIKKFELRFANGANIRVSSTVAEDQTYATGTCTKTESVTVNITCCSDFAVKRNSYKQLGSKNFKMKKWFKVHYRERHGEQSVSSCFDYYLSFVRDEKTHLKAKTVLKIQKKVKIGPIKFSYWQRTIASDISAGVTGTFRTDDSNNGCNCEMPETWNHGKINHNRRQVVYRQNTPELYKINSNDNLRSYHRAVKNGFIWDSSTDGTVDIIKPVGACSP